MSASVEIRREDHHSLPSYAAVPCAYEVRATISGLGPGAPDLPLARTELAQAFHKDYDALAGNHPGDWPARFSVERAHILGAYHLQRRLGGAIVIVDGADTLRLGGVAGFALLWDLRVAPEARGAGIGRALLRAAERSAGDAGACGMIIETQHTNVAACELYARAGYVITKVDANAYPTLPDEVQLIWTRRFELPVASA